jgi:NAD(P)-dependent dehydrogenase (short-subunit alcohol dehydrogenase family)
VHLIAVLQRIASPPLLAQQLAAEWAPHQINVNLVAPTFVRTQQVARITATQ